MATALPACSQWQQLIITVLQLCVLVQYICLWVILCSIQGQICQRKHQISQHLAKQPGCPTNLLAL